MYHLGKGKGKQIRNISTPPFSTIRHMLKKGIDIDNNGFEWEWEERGCGSSTMQYDWDRQR
jgi:hypothetical protein